MTHAADAKRPFLITGGTGFIGERLVTRLAPDFHVIVLDIQRPQSLPDDARWMECDLTSDEEVSSTMKSVRDKFGSHLAGVIHLAAYYDFSGEPSPLYEELTVKGTRRLIDALEDFDVEQFIFSSSLLVMKPVPETQSEPLTEDDATRAEWDYPQSKLEAEAVLRRHHGEIPLVILRIAGVYADDGRSLPIVQQIKRIREKKLESLFFPGDKEHGQPFVHADDLANCFRKAVDRRWELDREELFLIAEPDIMSYEELQNRIGELVHGRQWPTFRIPAPLAKAGAWAEEKFKGDESFIKPWMVDLADDHYPVEIKRAAEKLGWTPQHRLRDTLPKIIDEMKRDPKRWYEINKLPWPEEEDDS